MKKIKILLLLLSISGFIIPAQAQVSFGNPEKFNNGWLFTLSDKPDYIKNSFDDSKWRKLDLPHDWSIEGQMSPTLASCTGYLPGGIGWYRKHFTVADNAPRHYIYFEGAYNRSEVYLNGHLLGKRPNGYISFLYDMTPYLQKGENILSVRIDHSRYADSRWYTGSGIYRDVWMIAAQDMHFAQWGVSWEAESITPKTASVKVGMNIEKHHDIDGKIEVAAILYDAANNIVAKGKSRIKDGLKGETKTFMNLSVRKPVLWNLDAPYLYRLETSLYCNGKKTDRCETNVGLRTLEFDADKGFALNGKRMKVKGVCLHHDAGVLGAVVPEEIWVRKLKGLKNIGVNAIRLSHNPQAPVVYDLCDKMGLLVMDEASDEWEFPKRKWLEGWNVGTPGFQGTYDFFKEWIERDVTDMVRRDRNHACVFLWSIGNEVDYPNDPYSHPILDGSKINQPMFGGYKPEAPNAERIGKIAKRLAKCVRNVDTSRPTTGALAGVVMSNETEYPEAVDIVGYNYTEDRYETDHKTYPKRIIYGSETVADLNAWHAVRDKDYIFGQFIWTGTDYLGESNRWPSRGFNTGLLDFGSFIKPRGHFRASLWKETPMIYVGTYKGSHLSIDAQDTWNYEKGDKVRVVCYTNTAQARLLLNGKEVGAMKPYDDKTGIICWDIPYEPGELKAVGFDKDGNAKAEYAIRTCNRPFAIKATAEDKEVSPFKATTCVLVEIVDENGILVKPGDNNITCKVSGPAKLLGMENSDNRDTSDITDNVHRVYQGKMLVYLQTTGKEGDINVEFTSPLLKKCSVTLAAKNK